MKPVFTLRKMYYWMTGKIFEFDLLLKLGTAKKKEEEYFFFWLKGDSLTRTNVFISKLAHKFISGVFQVHCRQLNKPALTQQEG